MRKGALLLLLSIFILPYGIFSQTPVNLVGGRAFGVSGAAVTYQDVWAQYHNQAALASLKAINVGLGFQNAFFVKELSTKSLAFALPLKSGVFGVNYYYFGYPKFNENKIGLAYAKALGKRISVGIQLDYLYTQIEGEYGQQGVAAGEIGVLAEPIDNLLIGAHVFNLWNAKRKSYENEYLPTIFKIGASYRLYEIALLSVEVEKDLELEPIFKTGLEFEVIENLYFRTGISTNPNIFSFGIGYVYKPFEINIAFSKHPVLDYSPSISIIYSFKDRL